MENKVGGERGGGKVPPGEGERGCPSTLGVGQEVVVGGWEVRARCLVAPGVSLAVITAVEEQLGFSPAMYDMRGERGEGNGAYV